MGRTMVEKLHNELMFWGLGSWVNGFSGFGGMRVSGKV